VTKINVCDRAGIGYSYEQRLRLKWLLQYVFRCCFIFLQQKDRLRASNTPRERHK